MNFSARLTVAILGVAIAMSNLVAGCSLFTTQNAKTALTIAEIACAIAHAELADQNVAQVCGVADVLIPDLQQILSEQRKQVAKAKAVGACLDGGSP